MKTPLFTAPNFSAHHFSLLLNKCIKARALKPCKQIHALSLTSSADMRCLSQDSRLVGVYASCGDVGSAQLMLRETKNPNVFAFNWIIYAMAWNRCYEQAIGYFALMQQSRNTPNTHTFTVVLKACIGLMDVNKGKEIHGLVHKLDWQLDVPLGNALIDMYCKCGNIDNARKVFDKMVDRNIVSWTSLISGYASVGHIETSLVLFERMKLEGLEPNDFTWNALIAGYARKGDIDATFALFSRMSREGLTPDLVAWNAIISGLIRGKKPAEALQVFCDMLLARIKPNEVTITGLLPACWLMNSIQRGKEIHCLIYRMGLTLNVFVSSALIDMYSKCGHLKDAWNAFKTVPVKNVTTFNAMIGCYGKQGMVNSAIQLFEQMEDEGEQANQVTLTSVLSACSHGGLVEKGLLIFRSMRERYGVEPSKEHYSCIVDLCCRCGRMEEAYTMLHKIPVGITDSIAGAFFNGCKLHGRRDLATKMARDILRMDLKRPGGFVTLSNIYAAVGEWEEVENVRKVMKDKGIHKKPGFSCSEKER